MRTIQSGILDEFFRVENQAGESSDAVNDVVAHHIGRQNRPKNGMVKPFVKKFKVKFWLTLLGVVKMRLVYCTAPIKIRFADLKPFSTKNIRCHKVATCWCQESEVKNYGFSKYEKN